METTTAHISRRCRPFIASAIVISALFVSISARAGSEAANVQFTQTRSVNHRHAVRPGYGWPVKPFYRQHPVRGYLDDPRNGGGTKNFHFGIDISAPDGTPVYAVEAGEVFLKRGRDAVTVKGSTRVFSYWHVVPAVHPHQRVRLHQLLGHISAGEGHVHLAERAAGGYRRNPLRPGGLGPYVDRTPPTIVSVEFLSNGHEVDANALAGRVDIVVEAIDTTPLLVPAPWSRLPVSPERIRWSLASGGRQIVGPRTVADFSRWLRPELYDSIYAPGTIQNRLGVAGHYRFYLAKGFRASQLRAGAARLRVEASDTRGNRAVAQLRVSAAGR